VRKKYIRIKKLTVLKITAVCLTPDLILKSKKAKRISKAITPSITNHHGKSEFKLQVAFSLAPKTCPWEELLEDLEEEVEELELLELDEELLEEESEEELDVSKTGINWGLLFLALLGTCGGIEFELDTGGLEGLLG